MTGINRKNGSLRVNLSFATNRQFRSKMPFLQQLRSAFRNYEIDVTVLRSGTRVPNPTFAIAKVPAEWDFWCEIMLFHFAMHFAAAKWMLLYCGVALVCQTPLSQLRNTFAETSTVLRNVWQQNAHFAEVSFTLRNFAELCFSPVYALFRLQFRPDFFSFQFP